MQLLRVVYLAAMALACAGGAVELTAAQTVAPGAKKPCLEAGGVAIKLNGNFGFCYLKGQRMRRGSVFAQCSDGALSCYEDEGIPDKPRKKVTCIAPEPGFCGAAKDATPAPSLTPSATPKPASTSGSAGGNNTDVDETEVGDEDVSGDNAITDGPDRSNDDEDEDEDDNDGGYANEVRSATKPRNINPSALVAGNLPNGETYEDEEADDEDGGNAHDEDDDDGVYRY